MKPLQPTLSHTKLNGKSVVWNHIQFAPNLTKSYYVAL